MQDEQQDGGPVNCSQSELCTFLQALAEGYLPMSSLDTPPSAPLRSTPIASRSYRLGRKTVAFHGFPSFQMFRSLMVPHGADSLTASWRDSLARISASPAKEPDLTERSQVFGEKSLGSFATLDPDTRSWRTRQHSLLGGLTLFSGTWPSAGMMQSGVCSEAEPLEPGTIASAFGFWLSTPCASECKDRGNAGVLARLDRGGRLARNICARHWKTQSTLKVQSSPSFMELSMDWPTGWSACTPLAMDRFQAWRHSHGEP